MRWPRAGILISNSWRARNSSGFDPDIPTRKAVDQIFRDHKLEIEPVMEFDNIETVKRAVEIDHGIAIVPQATVLQEVKQGTLIAVHFKGKDFYPGRWPSSIARAACLRRR